MRKRNLTCYLIYFSFTWLGRAVYALRKGLEKINYRIDRVADHFSQENH
ncbi:hypothetical protein [Phaeodactylibacter xiamenensis]|nr:hypothetical protein [Phaeodactylibacter xiamenensis]